MKPLPCSAAMAAVLVALLAGCSEDPTGFENRRPFDPPQELYATWWTELRLCTALEGDRAGIRWFLADRIDEEGLVHGQWNSRREITLRTDFEWESWVVKHEMLHDLLRGDGEHADPRWRNGCVPDPPRPGGR